MATRPEQPFKLQQAPLIHVYRGSKTVNRPPVGFSGGAGMPGGQMGGGQFDEEFYQDEIGNDVTDFNTSTHKVIGTLGKENVSSITGKKTYQRIPNKTTEPMPSWMPKFGPAYTGPLAPNRPPHTGPPLLYNGDPYKPLDLGSMIRGGKAAPSAPAAPAAPSNPAAAIRASAAQPQQMSIGDRMADDIRKSGRMTAADQTLQDIDFGNQMYNKANPNAPAGSLAAREAALARMRPNVLQGSGIREFKRPDGSMGAHSTLPDAIIPESTANGSSGTTYRERAYGKHFATPEPTGKGEGWFGGETPMIRSGGNWVGDNPVTGEFKDPEGNIWTGEKAFRNSQLGESGLVETDGIPEDNTPYQPLEADPLPPMSPEAQRDTDKAQGYADNVISGIMRKRTQETAQGMANDQLRYAKAADYYRRNDAGKAYVINAQGKRQMEPVEPEMTTEDYIRQGNVLATQGAKSKLPPAYRPRRIEPPMSTQDYIRQGQNMQRRGNKENYDTRGYNGQM